MDPVGRQGTTASSTRRVLLSRLLSNRTRETERSIARCSVGPGPWPCSFAQRRLWFLDELVGSNPFYNLATAVRLPFAVDSRALEGSLTEIVRRHDVLRTTYASVAGEPMQMVSPATGFSLSRIDLRQSPRETQEGELARAASEYARQPFDLRNGPIFRAALLQLDATDFVLLLAMHHIASDGWSATVLGRELEALYPAIAMGLPSPLPELPVQYADYAVWQREWLTNEVLEQQLAYWKEQLAGLPTLQLPTDRPRPPLPSFRGATEPLSLPAPLVSRLRALGQQERTTLFMTLLAGFQALLSRYAGQTDIVVGAPVAGRPRAELESLVGFFVNTIVLRTELAGDPTVRELVVRVRRVALAAFAHQDLPFEKLVEELQPHRDLSRNPLFQVAFQLLNAPAGHDAPADATSAVPIAKQSAVLDLTVTLSEEGDQVGGTIEYCTDLFDPATIVRLAEHYRRLLEAMVGNPDQRISTLPLLTEGERRQILVDWNQTARDYPRNRSLQELFEQQVRAVPDAIAVSAATEELTYAALNQRANAVAARLRALGVATGVRVAIALDRSPDMVAAVLGTIKAGGTYVPLDASYPPARLSFMLRDSGARVLLTSVSLRDRLPPADVEVVTLDADPLAPPSQADVDVAGGATADSTAYVMYTSGSTGQPKGVAVPHRGISRLVINTDYVTIGHADRMGMVSSFSFDAATFEIWGALLNGAALVILHRDITLSPLELASELRQRGVTVLFLTAALFHYVAAKQPDAFETLHALLVGGDVVDPRSAAVVRRYGPPRRLLNAYGPTETTTFATTYEVRELSAGARTVPIGRPIANTTVYVLDDAGGPVPVGIVGELFIGGDGLAKEYVNDPELTARKFVPNPFAASPGERMYRTGDLVRWRADGHLEFVGRRDNQVKVRGFRVELGEIEAALKQHAAVRDGLVLTRRREQGDLRLDAYVAVDRVADGTAGSTASSADLVRDLRRHLQQRLPEFMVPANVVVLDAFPLTANGKIDRGALPLPDSSDATEATDVVSPRTETERTVAAIWRELLGISAVGVHHNFFTDLGGHSLLATQVASRIREAFQINLPLRWLFERPTIAELASAVEETVLAEVEHLSEDDARRSLDG